MNTGTIIQVIACGIGLIISIVAFVGAIINHHANNTKIKSYTESTFLGKLPNGDDSIEDAVKYLKLVNSQNE